jgi:Flp pilus assembly protein CpaB
MILVAVACGLGANYMTGKFLAERSKQQPVIPTVPVLVAKERIPAWQPIRDPEKLFEIKEYPENVVSFKAVGSFEELKDQQLRMPLDPGKPLTQFDLLTKEQREVALQIQPGQRAVAFKVHLESLGDDGCILFGSRVDLSATIGGRNASTRTFLRDVLVLAVDSVDMPAGGWSEEPAIPVTLALTPAQMDAVAEMEKQEAKLWIRLHAKEKPKQQARPRSRP